MSRQLVILKNQIVHHRQMETVLAEKEIAVIRQLLGRINLL